MKKAKNGYLALACINREAQNDQYCTTHHFDWIKSLNTNCWFEPNVLFIQIYKYTNYIMVF